MFRLLVEKELRDLIRSPKFAVTFAICSALILLSFGVGANEHKVALEKHEAARRQNLLQLEGLTDWLSVQHHRIFMPPEPLAALVAGVSGDVGRSIEVRGRGEPAPEDSRYNDDPILAVFRLLDLDFLFQVVLTLFAIVFAFDAVNGEKERGTLRLAMANAVPRRTFILGKIVGTLFALLAPLLLPLLIGCALLPAFGVPLSGEQWARLALILGSGLLLVGIFVVLSVLVSSATRRASSSFLILLMIWIGAVLVVPRASILLAGRAVQVASVDEIASQTSRLASQLWSEDRKAMGSFMPTNATEPEQAMVELRKFMNTQQEERDKKLGALTQRLNEERRNAQERQSDLALNLARVSPTAVFSLAASSLAGTSLSLPRHYQEQAAAYQSDYGKFLLEKTGMNPGGGRVVMRMIRAGDGEAEKEKPIDPKELPEFHYQPLALGDVIRPALVNFALLGVFGACFLLGAVRLFDRYDVR